MHAQRLVQKVFTRRYVFLTSATTTIRSTGLIQNWIQKAFSPRYLLLTNTLTCGGLLGVADYVVQKIENRWHGKAGQPVDWGRVLRVTAVGCIWGPMNHVWYRWLDRNVKLGTHAQKVAKKVLADFLVSPLFVLTFLTGIATLERKPIYEPIIEYQRKFADYMKLEVGIWPPIQAVNFWFVPPALRVFYVSCGQLIYNCFMTAIKHSDVEDVKIYVNNDNMLLA